MAKNTKKIKKANPFIFFIIRLFLAPILKLKYRVSFDRKSSKNIKRPCLILSNHQTSFDQFIVTMGFYFGINIVGSDSLFRHGLLSKLMRLLARPIPITKGNTDSTAVKQIMQIIKAGGAVEMFPSGNRSFFGEESHINPSIAKLAKKLNVPVVLVVMRGGFNTKSRWMHKPSKGKLLLSVTRVIEPHELEELSSEQIFDIINSELGFNEYEWNRINKIKYKGKHKAEYLESALFYCPHCHALDNLSSKGNEVFCKKCGAMAIIDQEGFFQNIGSSNSFPDNMASWGKMQLQYIKSMDYTPYHDIPLFEDSGITLSKIHRAKKDEVLKHAGHIAIYNNKIVICEKEILLSQITNMSLQGSKRLQIYTLDGAFTADAPMRTNLLKYLVCGYHLRNTILNIKEEYYGY